MYKKIITTIIILLFVVNTTISSFAQEQAQIVVSNSIVEAGTSDIIIDIEMKNNPGIVSAKVTIDFDSDVLTLTNVADKGILGNVYHSPFLDSPYNLYWNNGSSPKNFTTNGILATLTFSVKADAAPGTYPIFISYDEDNILNKDMDNVYFDVVNGSITVEKPGSTNIPTIEVGGISFDISLNADDYSGIIVAALYTGNGKFQCMKTYPASENVRVSFDKGMTGSYAKIMWWESLNSLKPICESQTLFFK